MFKEILQSSVRTLLERPKIIRLALLTLFCFSVVRLYYIIYYFNNILIRKYEGWVQISDALMYFISTLNEHHALLTVIIAVIVIIVWYLWLYPIGQASIVYALHEPQNTNLKSFMKGMNRFFPMLEYWWLSIPFWLFTFATVLIRIYLMDIFDSIALEWCPVFDAIKKSTKVAASNLVLSFKLMLVELILLLRFFVIWAIIVWIPLWLVYIAVWLDILNNSFVEGIIWVVCWALILILSYINCIIEAFFITYWYKAYTALIEKE